MLNKDLITFIGCGCDYEEAGIVLFGAPFDSTSSYRSGSKFGPNRMRAESDGAIETYSPYQNKDLEDAFICDLGDLTLPFGGAEASLDIIYGHFKQILADNKIPLMIGGEHLVTLGGVRACAEKYPDLHIIHFDAHADLRVDYLGQRLSHATVIQRSWELVGDGRIYQLGIRSGSKEEFAFAREGHTHMCKFDCRDIDIIVDKLNGKPVYMTIDLDVLDPSVFPGTGTPEAGGISFNKLVDCIKLIGGLNIVAADINEFSPMCDPSGVSASVACKVLRELLLAVSI